MQSERPGFFTALFALALTPPKAGLLALASGAVVIGATPNPGETKPSSGELGSHLGIQG